MGRNRKKKLIATDEANHYNIRIKKRKPPQKVDIIDEYYYPRITFGKIGKTKMGDNV